MTPFSHHQSEFSKHFKSFQEAKKRGAPDLIERALGLVKNFEILGNAFYRSRHRLQTNDPARRRSEEYLAQASHEIIALQKIKNERSLYADFIYHYRRAWQENFSLFLFTLILFIMSGLLGWHITRVDPNNALTFLSPHMMEDVMAKRPWFEDGVGAEGITAYLLANNNIMVSINSFLGGALLGLGGMYILLFNGLMVGSVLAYCYVNNFHEQLIEFIVGHGVLELTIIIAATFTGFIFGRVFYMRPYRLFKTRISLAANDAKYLILGILPWLIVAAIVEAFVSPSHFFNPQGKILISFVITLAFWLWTLWPMKKVAADFSA